MTGPRPVGPIRGGSSRCEAASTPGHVCGFRASWWDGHRFLCRVHRPVTPVRLDPDDLAPVDLFDHIEPGA